MTLALFMDHHVPRQITQGLRLPGIDVITAYEDGAHELEDTDLLLRATSLGRALFTRDDLLVIARAIGSEKASPSLGSFSPINFVSQLAGVSTIWS